MNERQSPDDEGHAVTDAYVMDDSCLHDGSEITSETTSSGYDDSFQQPVAQEVQEEITNSRQQGDGTTLVDGRLVPKRCEQRCRTQCTKFYCRNRKWVWALLIVAAAGEVLVLYYTIRSTHPPPSRLEAMRVAAADLVEDLVSSTNDEIFNRSLSFLARDPEMNIDRPNFLQRFCVVHFCLSASIYGNWTMHAAQFDYPGFTLTESVESVPWNGLNDRNECMWDGFLCNSEGEVTAFMGFVENTQSASFVKVIRMNGVFSDALFALPLLDNLRLNQANLRGRLPAKAPEAMHLKYLDLSSNRFTGSMPMEWTTSFRIMRRLNIAHNPINGPLLIPGQNEGYCELGVLDVSSTSLQGYIPESLAKCASSMRVFRASFTGLQGTLPESISSLHHLSHFYVDHTQLEGNATSLVMHTNLKEIFVQRTGLWGNLEDRPTTASRFIRGNIARSGFYGSVPQRVCFNHTFTADCDMHCPCCEICCDERQCFKLIP